MEILNVLTADGLVIDDTFVLELTFADFDGSSDEMGISVTETNIITNDASWSPSWRPFFGGLIDTLGIIIIALFGFVKLSQVEAKYRHQVHWYLKNAS